ncbi:hypothetical protein Dimus_007423 [Dionaea muscipula]
MTRNPIIIRSPPSMHRRQPLLSTHKSSSTGSQRFAEVAGGTAAECAAVCCCCPCGIVDLLVLAVYKVPAGLCRKALRSRRRRRLIKKGSVPLPLPLPSSSSSSSSSSLSSSLGSYNMTSSRRRRCGGFCGCDQTDLHIHPVVASLETVPEMEMGMEAEEEEEVFVTGREVAKELMELEKEMLDRFYTTGFWRSPSQREN